MASLPRIITVDPTWALSRIVRVAIDLSDRSAIQIDMPDGREALEEIRRGGCNLLITAVNIGDDMKGFELALSAKRAAEDLTVIILGEVDDLEMDEETRVESPFIYMRRPVDMQQFMRVLMAGIEGKDTFAAYTPAVVQNAVVDLGPVPPLDLKAAQVVIDKLLTDVGAMAIVLSSRAGDVLLERGAVGYLDREKLTNNLLPSITTLISMGELIGGQASALQFFDGDSYDVFVLSVGFHHMISIMFDGQSGGRQFGPITRYGRRAAEDLKALLGASAFKITPTAPAPEQATRRAKPAKAKPVEEEVIAEPLLKAEGLGEHTPKDTEPETLHLDPIENLDFSIFDNVATLSDSDADDLFNPERLAEIANESRRGRGPISYDEAMELGLLP